MVVVRRTADAAVATGRVSVDAGTGAAAFGAAICSELSVTSAAAAASVSDVAWSAIPASRAAAADVSAGAAATAASVTGAAASAVPPGAGAKAAVSAVVDSATSVLAAAVSRALMPTFEDDGPRLIAKASKAAPTRARAPVATHVG